MRPRPCPAAPWLGWVVEKAEFEAEAARLVAAATDRGVTIRRGRGTTTRSGVGPTVGVCVAVGVGGGFGSTKRWRRPS